MCIGRMQQTGYRASREEQAQMDEEWNDFLAFAAQRLELRPTGYYLCLNLFICYLFIYSFDVLYSVFLVIIFRDFVCFEWNGTVSLPLLQSNASNYAPQVRIVYYYDLLLLLFIYYILLLLFLFIVIYYCYYLFICLFVCLFVVYLFIIIIYHI